MCVVLWSGPFLTPGGTAGPGAPCYGLLCARVRVLVQSSTPGAEASPSKHTTKILCKQGGMGGFWTCWHLQQCSASHRQTCLLWSKLWQHNPMLYAPGYEIQPCSKFHSLLLQAPERTCPVPWHIRNPGATSSSSPPSAPVND